MTFYPLLKMLWISNYINQTWTYTGLRRLTQWQSFVFNSPHFLNLNKIQQASYKQKCICSHKNLGYFDPQKTYFSMTKIQCVWRYKVLMAVILDGSWKMITGSWGLNISNHRSKEWIKTSLKQIGNETKHMWLPSYISFLLKNKFWVETFPQHVINENYIKILLKVLYLLKDVTLYIYEQN